MNITELLKSDHREVSALISQLQAAGEDAASGAHTETFQKLKNSLTLHARIEEEIFYPALESFEETEDLIEEAYEEHEEVKQLLDEMSGLEPDDTEFQDLLAQLKYNIDDHVEEEENEVFPQAENLLGEETLDAMGDEMQQIKQASGTMRMSGS
jgi:hemerythrin superfamily protein